MMDTRVSSVNLTPSHPHTLTHTHSASLATYNSLLYDIGNTVMTDPWNRAMVTCVCVCL